MRKTREVIDICNVIPITPEYIANRVDEIHEYVEKQIEMNHKTGNPLHQMLVLFPLLEAFAQEYANYPNGRESNKAFVNFVLKFQKSYDFLTDVDPITLYYDYEKELDGYVGLDGLSIGRIYYPNDSSIRQISNEIVSFFEMDAPDKKDEYINRHKYINLLYRLRSKLIHEMTAPFTYINEQFENQCDIPHYWHRSMVFDEDNLIIREDDWTLHIPVIFIERLVLECIDGFLQYCITEKRDPAYNNKVTRKFYLSWYDY